MIEGTVEYAEQFLRGGGVVSLAEWMGFSVETKDNFRVAGDRIRWEIAGLAGVCAQNEILARTVLAGEDVEDVAVREVIRKTGDQIEGRLRKAAL